MFSTENVNATLVRVDALPYWSHKRNTMDKDGFYSPSPDKPLFVNVGDEVSPGSVVCIIEAMKLFNEIESEYSGKIVKMLVENASPVEFDQPLFLVDPS